MLVAVRADFKRVVGEADLIVGAITLATTLAELRGCLVLSEEHARSFASWGRAHGCKVVRRRLERAEPGEEYGVWRCP